jgi:hypothetical protein
MNGAKEVVAGSASSDLMGGSVGWDSASGAAVDHGSTAIRSGGDQPASPLARIASPGKSGSNLTAATGTFATSRAVLAEADHSGALERATGEPIARGLRAGAVEPESTERHVAGSVNTDLLDSGSERVK